MNGVVLAVLAVLAVSPWGVRALVTCPDKMSACPDGTTCCPLGEDTYGCCPIPKAVCCDDQRHCCPHDTMCDVQEGKCVQPSTGRRFPLHRKHPATRLVAQGSEEMDVPVLHAAHAPSDQSMRLSFPQPNAPTPHRSSFSEAFSDDVTCDDGKSKCPARTTCCDMGGDVYGCCPSPRAVCCTDHLHCCPEHTQCDVAEGRCLNTKTLESTPWFRKFSSTRVVKKTAIELRESTRPCAHGACPGDHTCCGDADEGTCCPFRQGVCCEHGRCCPKGYACSRGGGCTAKAFGVLVRAPSAKVTEVQSESESEEDSEKRVKTCPDDSECSADHTCCPVETGSGPVAFRCCPLKHAMCCADSCCPRGFHCKADKVCERSALTKELLKELFLN